MSPLCRDAVAVHVRDRIAGQPPDLDRPSEDGVHQHQLLVLGLVRDRLALAGLGHPGAPALDLGLGDVLEPHRAERRQQVRVQLRAVAADRRGLAAAVLGRVAQVLLGGVGERRLDLADRARRPPAGRPRPASRAASPGPSASCSSPRAVGRCRSRLARSASGAAARRARGSARTRPARAFARRRTTCPEPHLIAPKSTTFLLDGC